ncbi:MAG: hypothetical protein QGF03_06085 [SAR324 cluster bacterium]|nr:hypothetical protein [SAR324 cluster bacterium]
MTINDTLETCATCRFHDIPALYSRKGNTEEPRAWGYYRRHAPTKWEVKSPYERLERLGISPDQKLRGLKQLKAAGLVDCNYSGTPIFEYNTDFIGLILKLKIFEYLILKFKNQ